MAVQRTGLYRPYYQENSDEPLMLRIRLHTGELIREMEDSFGKKVILASNIVNQAHGGEILVLSWLKEPTESGGQPPIKSPTLSDADPVPLRGHRQYPIRV